MEKYLIGDEFGNMYCDDGNDEFYCNKGTIFQTREMAERMLKELNNKEDFKNKNWEFKIYTVSIK